METMTGNHDRANRHFEQHLAAAKDRGNEHLADAVSSRAIAAGLRLKLAASEEELASAAAREQVGDRLVHQLETALQGFQGRDKELLAEAASSRATIAELRLELAASKQKVETALKASANRQEEHLVDADRCAAIEEGLRLELAASKQQEAECAVRIADLDGTTRLLQEQVSCQARCPRAGWRWSYTVVEITRRCERNTVVCFRTAHGNDNLVGGDHMKQS